ncbi:MAG: AAA family ATPase [Burkholderiales bacterium]|nr:AAA family ATPase [Burkholderiales bacterium]
MLELTMFGVPALGRDGVPVAMKVRKSLALLMLLARSGGPVPRGRLVALLWPALDETTGRRNLRRELARLRETGVGEVIRADGDTLALGASVRCDADAFEAALAAGRPDDALAAWRGPPADGFALGDADAFDDWLVQQRRQLVARRQVALGASAAAREAAGDLAGALARIESLLADDPLQEQHHRDAMRLLAATGRREAALAQFERCRALLRSELDLTPMAQTEALAATLRGAAGAGAAVAPPPAAAEAPTASTGMRPTLLPSVLPFVGRAADVARMEAAWATGRPIVVEGEAGVGKSRLASDFAAAHGPFALARCRAGDAGLPYSSITRALRALMGPSSALPELPAWVGPELARLMPELGAAPPPIRSDEERNRFFEACASAWQALSADDFDAVIVDDWHLADAASRSLLAFIAGRRGDQVSAGARELLLLRPELDAAAAGLLADFVAATGALHLRLGPLPGDAVLEMVQRLSGADRPLRFAERLGRATGGNPFFLAETLRHLVEMELLTTSDDGRWHTPFDDDTDDYRELPVPASVREAVLARVQRLPAASRRVLEAAALAAEPFAPALLAPACALSELDAVLAIDDAIAAQLLREHDGGGFAFAHDLVQQALQESLGAERRRLVHRRLALGAESAGSPSATVAAHHEASGDLARAVAHRLAAGDEAMRLRALQEAIAQWRHGLADRPNPAQAIALHRRLLDAGTQLSALDVVGEQADGLALRLADPALSPAERIDATIARGLALSRSGRPVEGLAALDAMAGEPVGRQRFAYLWARSITLNSAGRNAEAQGAVEAALALDDIGDAERVDLLDFLFVCEREKGDLARALVHAESALALARKSGDRRALARAFFRSGLVKLHLHDVAEAEADMRAALVEVAPLGLVGFERIVLYNLSCVYSSQSRPVDALAVLQRGRQLSPPILPGHMRTVYRTGIADAQFTLGNLGACWEDAGPAATEALTAEDPVVRIGTAMCLTEPLWLLGELPSARALLASLTAEEMATLPVVAGELHVALAQLELKLGRIAAAEASLQAFHAGDGDVIERVRVREAQARAELALAHGDAEAALARLPADDTKGMNEEMRVRGLALRVRAESRLGSLSSRTVAAATYALAAPGVHRIAALELHAALAAAAHAGVEGAPADAAAGHAACVARLAASLEAHPIQQRAFVAGRAAEGGTEALTYNHAPP